MHFGSLIGSEHQPLHEMNEPIVALAGLLNIAGTFFWITSLSGYPGECQNCLDFGTQKHHQNFAAYRSHRGKMRPQFCAINTANIVSPCCCGLPSVSTPRGTRDVCPVVVEKSPLHSLTCLAWPWSVVGANA